MTLLNDFAHFCVVMEKSSLPDGAGGSITDWVEGKAFTAYYGLADSSETRKAEKESVSSVYTVLVDKAVRIKYGDFFKDTATGLTYRVTSNPDEKRSPRSASFSLKQFTAERKDLPKWS